MPILMITTAICRLRLATVRVLARFITAKSISQRNRLNLKSSTRPPAQERSGWPRGLDLCFDYQMTLRANWISLGSVASAEITPDPPMGLPSEAKSKELPSPLPGWGGTKLS